MNIWRLVPIRATFPQEVAILDLLLSLGIDINAQDKAGRRFFTSQRPMTLTPPRSNSSKTRCRSELEELERKARHPAIQERLACSR
ncbi:hypothetical protein [Mesorhizobium sp. WSM2561]|uniref:hypothetical protein n=1 Tax=Mesorhizobium sp. WSM2561 TaxID=1040985 RepID=UPI00047F8E1D|nr:hypothetical protein [Mesorhizobium sp. WSM2561]